MSEDFDCLNYLNAEMKLMSIPLSNHLERGLVLYEYKQYFEAEREFKAADNDIRCDILRAVMYLDGNAKDWFGETESLLTKPARNGNPQAMFLLAYAYFKGMTKKINEKEAKNWLKKAAALGHPQAKAVLKDVRWSWLKNLGFNFLQNSINSATDILFENGSDSIINTFKK